MPGATAADAVSTGARSVDSGTTGVVFPLAMVANAEMCTAPSGRARQMAADETQNLAHGK